MWRLGFSSIHTASLIPVFCPARVNVFLPSCEYLKSQTFTPEIPGFEKKTYRMWRSECFFRELKYVYRRSGEHFGNAPFTTHEYFEGGQRVRFRFVVYSTILLTHKTSSFHLHLLTPSQTKSRRGSRTSPPAINLFDLRFQIVCALVNVGFAR